MTKPHLKLRYYWSRGLQRFVWSVDFVLLVDGARLPASTSYSNSSAEALKKAGEYWPPTQYPQDIACREESK